MSDLDAWAWQQMDGAAPPMTAKDPRWPRLKGWLLMQVHELQLTLEMDLDDISTANVRGRIAQIREIISMIESPHNQTSAAGPN